MKKYVALIFVIILLFCGCNENDNVTTKLTNDNLPDYQYMFSGGSRMTSIQKTQGGYYVLSGDFIYYVDEKNMNTVPLCNKTNCMHTPDDKNCNAHFESLDGTYNMQVYKDKIYILSKELVEDKDGIANYKSVLYRLSLDGSEKDKFYTFEKLIYSFYIVDNYIFYDTMSEDEEGSYESNINNSIYKKSLDGNDSPKLVVNYSDYKGHYKYGCTIKNIYKGKLYVYECYQTVENIEKAKGEEAKQWNFVIIDLKNGKRIKELPMNNNSEENYFAGICHDKLLRSVINNKKKTETFYLSNLDGSNPKKLFGQKMNKDATVKYEVICDDKYIYSDNVNDKSAKKRWVEVYNTSGEKLSRVYYPDENTGIHLSVQGDDNYFWFENDGVVFVIEKTQFLNNNGKLEFKQIT